MILSSVESSPSIHISSKVIVAKLGQLLSPNFGCL